MFNASRQHVGQNNRLIEINTAIDARLIDPSHGTVPFRPETPIEDHVHSD